MLSPHGSTRVAGIIGDPVAHSLSPALHNAAYAAAGLDWVYVAFPVGAGRARGAVAAMRALGLAGLSVTMPHKSAVLTALDRLTPTADRLGAVNTISRAGDQLVGDNTDGPGFLDALVASGRLDLSGQSAVLLGTGGAARAVALALASAGLRSVTVVGRRRGAARRCAELAGRSGRAGTVAAVDDADLVINATPVGMTGTEVPFGLDPDRLGPGQLVVDLIYAPPVTPLLERAARRGAATANGVDMLVHQAGRQFTAWTGLVAPLAAMADAARAAIGPVRCGGRDQPGGATATRA